jgi:cytochrome c-type biogenesis protein CcmH/NrfF
MPEGYNPVRQVMINSFVNYWIPAYRKTVLIWFPVLVAFVASVVVVRRRQRKP